MATYVNETKKANRFAAVHRYYTNNDHTSQAITFNALSGTKYDHMYVGFPAPSSAYLRKKLVSASVGIYFRKNQSCTSGKYQAAILKSQWEASTVVGTTGYDYSGYGESDEQTVYDGYYYPKYVSFSGDDILSRLISYGALIWATQTNAEPYSIIIDVATPTNTTTSPYEIKPEILYTFDTDTTIQLEFESLSPSGGYVPKSASKTFTWATKANGFCASLPYATNYKFQWRVKDSATITTIDCGTATSYTVPANTFANDNIEWRCQVTDDSGTVITSSWIAISTKEVLSTAVPISPKNALLNGSEQIEFTWNHVISTGTEQTAADLQWSSDDSSFTTLGSVSGNAKTFTAPAGTFTSGNVYWRVRTYNTDNNASSWSASVKFLCVSAPATPVVSCTQTPRPLINWQATDMQGWQINIVNSLGEIVYDSGHKFGVTNSAKTPKYLGNGSYSVKVRVQNLYSLWSEWGESPLTVSNSAGTALTLSITNINNAILDWSLEAEYSEYIIYRDETPIAKTSSNQYIDRLCLGTHTYFVRGIYSNSDNYGVSNTVTTTIDARYSYIRDIETDNEIDITKSTQSLRSVSVSMRNESYSQKYTAFSYPVIEMTKYKDESLTLECGFSDISEIETFESMIGHIVCLKTENMDFIIGLLGSVVRKRNKFLTSYSFSITRCAFDEEIDI